MKDIIPLERGNKTPCATGKPTARFDSLSFYHHLNYPIDPKLHELLEILDQPKETHLEERFRKIREILDEQFSLELANRLHLEEILPKKSNSSLFEDAHHHPKQILHLLFALYCTDSVEYIAEHTNLTYTETAELFRELSKSYTIDSLISRILQLYYSNKHFKEQASLKNHEAHLGLELTTVPEDTHEERRRRMLRKYKDIVNIKKHLLLKE